MKKSQFFSIYVLIHGLVLALVIGMGAAAFSMSNGLLILEAPTTATTSANTRGNLVARLVNGQDQLKKSLKSVAGGCEMWDTGTFWRVKRWGVATSSPYSNLSMTCSCPTGYTQTSLGTSSISVSDVRNAQWYHHYYSQNWNVNNPVLCTKLTSVSNHNTDINQVDFHVTPLQNPDYAAYNLRHCYKALCGGSCDCSKEPNDLEYYTQMMSRGVFMDYTIALMNQLIPPVQASTALGCGLVMMYQSAALPAVQTATVEKWSCVANTAPGWDN